MTKLQQYIDQLAKVKRRLTIKHGQAKSNRVTKKLPIAKRIPKIRDDSSVKHSLTAARNLPISDKSNLDQQVALVEVMAEKYRSDTVINEFNSIIEFTPKRRSQRLVDQKSGFSDSMGSAVLPLAIKYKPIETKEVEQDIFERMGLTEVVVRVNVNRLHAKQIQSARTIRDPDMVLSEQLKEEIDTEEKYDKEKVK